MTHLHPSEVRSDQAHTCEERRPEHEPQSQVQPHQHEPDAATQDGERVQQQRDLALLQAQRHQAMGTVIASPSRDRPCG